MIKRLLFGLTAAVAGFLLAVSSSPTAGYAVGVPPRADIIWTGAPAASRSAGVDAPKGSPQPGQLNAKSACGSPSVCYTYNGVSQFIGSGAAGVGADAVLVSTSQHKPYKDSADFHSLWELSVQGVSTSGGDRNIVEIGWTMDAAVCGAVFTAGNPCLFVYHWVNNVNSCYNGCGWVDNPTESVNAGTALATTAGGASPTVFYEYKAEHASSVKCDDVAPVQTTATPGWLMYQQNVGSTRLIGCFPDTLWTSQGETFTKIHLVQAFQEGATSDDHTCSDFGSGIFSPASWGTLSASQWQKAYTLTNPPSGVTPAWGTSAATSPSFNNPTAVRILKDPSSNEVRTGGPGFDVQGGTATGTAGNC